MNAVGRSENLLAKDAMSRKPSTAVITVLFASKRRANCESRKSAKNVAMTFMQPEKENSAITVKLNAVAVNRSPMARSNA
jgi:hypothetical protein